MSCNPDYHCANCGEEPNVLYNQTILYTTEELSEEKIANFCSYWCLEEWLVDSDATIIDVW